MPFGCHAGFAGVAVCSCPRVRLRRQLEALVRRSGVKLLSLVFRGLVPGLGVAGAPTCKYYPSCSQYAGDAMRKYGPVWGTLKAAWRLVRCNPWSRGGVDFA